MHWRRRELDKFYARREKAVWMHWRRRELDKFYARREKAVWRLYKAFRRGK